MSISPIGSAPPLSASEAVHRTEPAHETQKIRSESRLLPQGVHRGLADRVPAKANNVLLQNASRADRQAYRRHTAAAWQARKGAKARSPADRALRRDVEDQADQVLMSARHADASAEDLADESSQPDPLVGYLALLEAADVAGPDDPVTDLLEQSLDLLLERHGSDIVSGFNTLEPMLAFALNRGEWLDLRLIYRDCIVPGNLRKTFKKLRRYGDERLLELCEALHGSITGDLKSRLVCADKRRWQQQHLDLLSSQKICAMVRGARDLCSRLLKLKADEVPATKVVGFVGDTFELIASPSERKLDAMCAPLAPDAVVSEPLLDAVRQHLNQHVGVWDWTNLEARNELLFPY